MQEHLLILNNLKIFYRTFGNSDKQSLVYLHGWGSPRNNILGKGTIDIMDKLSKEFYCIAIDLPGLIKSEPPKEIWNFDEYANFLKKFIEQIGIMDIYDGRVPQEKVDFPVLQHFYWLRLEDGGETMNCESRIFLYPRNTDLSHLLSL